MKDLAFGDRVPIGLVESIAPSGTGTAATRTPDDAQLKQEHSQEEVPH